MKLENISNLESKKLSTVITVLTITYYILLFFVILFVHKIPDKIIIFGLFIPALFSLILLDFTKTILWIFIMQIGIQYFFDQQMTISNFTLMLPLLIGLILINKEKTIQVESFTIYSVILLNISSLILSVIFANNPLSSLFMLVNYFQAFLVFLFFVWFLDSENSLKTVLIFYIFGSLIPILVGLLQIISVIEINEMNRIHGTFMSSNEFAPFLAFNFLLFLSLGFYAKKKMVTLVLFGLAILNSYIFLHTYSRGAIIGLVGAIFTFMFIKIKLSKLIRIFFIIFLIIIFAGLGMTFGMERYFVRFVEIGTGGFDQSTLERVGVWEAALQLFTISPIVGVGINNFQELYPRFFPTYGIRFTSDELYHAHNLFLNTLTEQGIIGFIVLIVTIFYIIKILMMINKNHTSKINIHLAPFLSSFFVYFLLHNIFDCVWTAYYHVALQMQLALYFAIIVFFGKNLRRITQV